ncbi:MAG: DUF4386 domain-containing protein [Chloroflexi bacterium]|nr:DUF4386 domain-containing protein [Chloroflexota bacterium]MBI5292496.1 DUF4386 domain-containing protein [Chloroflexota bacterium]
MKNNTLSKLGGTLSILVGVSYVLVGIAYVLMPTDQRPGSDVAQFLPSFAQNPMWLLLEYWAFALGALLALGAVLAISETVRPANEGWVRWASSLATVGFAVTAINFFRLLALQPARAAAYVAGDASIKAAIAATQESLSLDPQGWLGFGAVGLWVLVVSLLALRAGAWPKNLAYVGIAVAIAYWLVVAGYVFNIETLILIAASLGGIILGPIWYIWTGLRLRQAG